MAKKPKDDVPNPNNVANREILQRMNFLYQASVLLNHTNAHPPRPPKPVKRKEDAVLAMLTKKDTPFSWGSEQQTAFDTLKSKFINDPILATFDPDRKTHVESDASGWSVGGALVQKDEKGA